MADIQAAQSTTKSAAPFDMQYADETRAARALDEARVAGIRAALEQAAQKLRCHTWFARFEFAEGGAPVIVDGRAAGDPRTKPDCIVRAPAQEIAYLLNGDIDPRFALLYQRIAVEGSAEVATLLCDRLVGRELAVSMKLGSGEALPAPTTDLNLARAQFQRFGYCLVKDALSSEHVERVKQRLIEQAAAEKEAGCGWMDGDPGNPEPPNQRVWALMNKGKPFLDLMEHPLVDQFMPDLLGANFLLSNYQANITAPGGKAMYLHNDQIWVQPPIPQVRFGANIIWFLDDVTEENGGTRLLPGSHVGDVAPANIFTPEGTTFASGAKGTALLFDSRLWHGTGANVSKAKRHVILAFYVRSWIRTVENMNLTVRPEVFAQLSDRLKTQLGYRCTGSMGGVDGLVDGQLFDQGHSKIGEMRPKVSA